MNPSPRLLLVLAGVSLAAPTFAQSAPTRGASAERDKKTPARPAAAPSAPAGAGQPAQGAAGSTAPGSAGQPAQGSAGHAASTPLRPAVSRVVDAIARALLPAGRAAVVVTAPLVSDAAAPRGAQLTALLAAQLAGRLGEGTQARVEPAALSAARATAAGAPWLVHLGVEIAVGKLRVTADVYPVPRTVWARIRDPEPGPVAHAYAEASLDAEVRSFLAPVSLTAALSVERARNFESDVVALACGDVNGDGGPEIVSVSRRRVSLLRLSGGKVVPLLSRSWADLVGVHPTPWREPVGFATLVTREQGGDELPGFVDVGLTDRARSVRFDGALQVLAELPGLAVPDGGGSACTRVGGLSVSGALARCVAEDPAPASATVGGQYDALASARLLSSSGEPLLVWAGRERGALELRDSSGRRQVLSSAGAQIALGDLDQDGEPEVLASLDVQNAIDDAVVVWSWPRRAQGRPKGGASAVAQGDDRLQEALRLPAPAGVHAVAVCPPDGPGRAPFVVATSDEIWVVR
ncbi:hypothetical protein [Chondromyces crocatus]|uniref:VCBS repeat-containing protein n=1 Tax=Chondromyces crocatus TaxID=52 RepID=A0A0K1E889_CHOCO|nr:hypothetical protein [Chondromyces crocatus]AKT37086.1 uncharacterized protein CMC5_012120 [Chondromyces crocatus]